MICRPNVGTKSGKRRGGDEMSTVGETSRHDGAEISPSWLRFGSLCIALVQTRGRLFCRQHFQTKLNPLGCLHV